MEAFLGITIGLAVGLVSGWEISTLRKGFSTLLRKSYRVCSWPWR